MAFLFPKPKKAAAASPYDWTTKEVDPLTENPRVLATLAPWQAGVNTAAQNYTTRLGADQSAEDGLYNTLRGQASNELALGGDLSADEVRAMDQGVLAGAQSRGLTRSPMTGFRAALMRTGAATQRRRERQGFAQGLLQFGQQRRQTDAGVLGTLAGIGQQGNEFAEDIRRFGLNRYDTRQFNKNNIQKDIDTANKNASAAKSAGKSSMLGSVIGGVLKLL